MKRNSKPIALALTALMAVSAPAQAEPSAERAENVILMIGDGMGESQVLATRLFYAGRDGRLAMETLPIYSQASTLAANRVVTDSAAAATAFATGTRTDTGRIAQDPAGRSTLADSLLLLARGAGKSTGLITDVWLAHATPAPFAASVPSRRMMNEIAEQYLANGVDVLLGGGESNFRPQGASGTHCAPGRTQRTDGRDLVAEAARLGYQVVANEAQI